MSKEIAASMTRESVYAAAKSRGVSFGPPAGYGPSKRPEVKCFLSTLGFGNSKEVRQKWLDMLRGGEVTLTRLDLVGAVPQDQRKLLIEESEIQDKGSTFHCVMVPEASRSM